MAFPASEITRNVDALAINMHYKKLYTGKMY